MNKEKFNPELHDIGKLLYRKDCRYMISHYFNIQELRKDGISLPKNKTFEGIQKHHISESTNPEIMKDIDIILLKSADHFASGFSRLNDSESNKKTKNKNKKTKNKEKKPIINEEVKKLIRPEYKSVYKLWNKNKQINIKNKLINCTKKNIEAILNIVANDDWNTLSSNYNELLNMVPEDIMPLFNVVSLKTHMTLVGKACRFLKSQVRNFNKGKIEFFGDKLRSFTGVKDLEKTVLFKLVFVSVSMPKFIARVNDLAFFEILDNQLNKLRQEDQILFVSPESFLFICNKEEETREVKFVKELVDLGFSLETIEITKPLSELAELPREIVNNEIKTQVESLEKILQNKKIPKDKKDKKKQEFIKNYGEFYHIYEPQRPEEIRNLCDICQQNEATPYNKLTDEEKKLVTKEEDGKKIIESLCKYCINIRKEYEKSGNLKSFAKWEDEKPRPDALWIKIFLDIDNLSEALEKNYERYIDDVLKDDSTLAQEVKKQYKLRYTWISEFLYEYDKFLEEFYESLKKSLETIKINRDFFVAKKKEKGQVKEVIDIYTELFRKHFPDFIKFKEAPPIRFGIIWTNVKSPLVEVWREINKIERPVSVILKNRNRLETDVKTISDLSKELSLTAMNISNFLHKLTAIYEQSGLSLLPLIEVFNERWKYKNLYEVLSEKNLSILDILNWYKIVKE